MRDRSRRLLPRRWCGAIAPRLRGAAQIDAVARARPGASEPARGGAAPRLARTGSTTPATSRGRLLIYWWISGYFADVRVWMLELLGQGAADHCPHARDRDVLRAVGASSGSARATRWWRGSARACDCSPRAATNRPPRWRSRRRRRRGCSSPTSTRHGTRRASRRAIATLHALGDRWAESLAEVALGQLGVVCRDIPASARPFRPRGRDRRGSGRRLHARRRRQQPRAPEVHARRSGVRGRGVRPHPERWRYACTSTTARPTGSRGSARSPPLGATAGARARSPRSQPTIRETHRRVRHRRVRGAPRAARGPARPPTPRASRRREPGRRWLSRTPSPSHCPNPRPICRRASPSW